MEEFKLFFNPTKGGSQCKYFATQVCGCNLQAATQEVPSSMWFLGLEPRTPCM